jgi:hypothetical protein
VIPPWYGDSVGHYEGDTLVIDTVGINIGPFSMVDWYGTPHTEALHVVERYRLLEQEAAKVYWERNAKENFRIRSNDGGAEVDPTYTGKSLQLQCTVEDEVVSPCHGRRPLLIAVRWRNRRNLSVLKTRMSTTRERTPRSRPPSSLISKRLPLPQLSHTRREGQGAVSQSE